MARTPERNGRALPTSFRQRLRPIPRREPSLSSDDFFLCRIPSDRAPGVEAFDCHAAGDRNAETDIERAVRLLSVSDAVEEVLHMRARRGVGLAEHFDAVGPIHFLRQVTDLLASGDGAVCAQNVLSDAELVITE